MGEPIMSFPWPVVLISIWLILMLATVVQLGRFVGRFRQRYSELGPRAVAFYLFSKAALEALGADPGLCRERQRFVALVVAMGAFWLAGVATMCIVGMRLT